MSTPRRTAGLTTRLGLLAPLGLAALSCTAGCSTLTVAWMQPRADGAVEFTLFERHKSPNLHPKSGGAFTLDEHSTVSRRVRWVTGQPPQRIEPEQPVAVTAPLPGLVPQRSVPVSYCSPVGAAADPAPASDARQSEGDPVLWCSWFGHGGPGPGGSQRPRIEARSPGAAAPIFSLALDEPGASRRLVPLPGRRALLQRGQKTWLLDASSGAAIPLADQEVQLRGATPEGDVLLAQVFERPEAQGALSLAMTLRLRSGQTLQLPPSALSLVSAAGALWLYDPKDRQLQRIEPESGRITAAATPLPASSPASSPAGSGLSPGPVPQLLGADAAGCLWFESDAPAVRPGQPLRLWRWKPSSKTYEVVLLPTQ